MLARIGGSSRAKRPGSGTGTPSGPTGKATADVERVERRQPALEERQEGQRPADRITPGIGSPQLRPDMEVEAAEPERSVRPSACFDRGRDLIRCQPELRDGRAGRQRSVCLRFHLRVEPEEHVQAERTVDATNGPDGTDGPRQGGGLLRRLQRDPVQRCARGGSPGGGPQVRVRLADPLQRDLGIRDARTRRERPFAARDDVRAETQPGEACHERREVVRLQRIAPFPRVGERRAHGPGSRFQGLDVRDVDRRAVSAGDRPQRGSQDPQPVAILAGRLGVHAVSPG